MVWDYLSGWFRRRVKPEPKPDPKPEPRPVPGPVVLGEYAQGLYDAGRMFPGAHVCESALHPLLQELATGHAEFIAARQYQDHSYFQRRSDRIRAELGLTAYEICAESWAWQADDGPRALGLEMFHLWQQSPGHWKTASRKWPFVGLNMARGKSGIWYACILAAGDFYPSIPRSAGS